MLKFDRCVDLLVQKTQNKFLDFSRNKVAALNQKDMCRTLKQIIVHTDVNYFPKADDAPYKEEL